MHRTVVIVIFCIFALFCAMASATKSHKAHVTKAHNDTKSDGNEMLPSLCKNGVTVTRAEREANLASLETCKYDRNNAIEVFKAGFDIDGNGEFTIDECYKAFRALVPVLAQPFVEHCDTIFRHCDCDNDGIITEWDFLTAKDTCLRNCHTIEEFMDRVGSRLDTNVRALIRVRTF